MKKSLLLSFLLLVASTFVAQAATYTPGQVHHIHSESEYNQVIQSGNVIVDFYGEWCGPCKRLSPLLAQLAKECANVIFIKVDADALKRIADQNNIRGLPTLVFFRDGKKIQVVSGLRSKAEYSTLIKELYKS